MVFEWSIDQFFLVSENDWVVKSRATWILNDHATSITSQSIWTRGTAIAVLYMSLLDRRRDLRYHLWGGFESLLSRIYQWLLVFDDFYSYNLCTHVLNCRYFWLEIIKNIKLLWNKHLKANLLITFKQCAHSINLTLIHLYKSFACVYLVLNVQEIDELGILL